MIFLLSALFSNLLLASSMERSAPKKTFQQTQECGEIKNDRCLPGKRGDWIAEIKGGYFQFKNGALNKIFSPGGWDVGTEFAYHWCAVPAGVWINGYYYRASGHAIQNGPSVSMDLGTMAVGGRFLFRPSSFLEFSLSAGPRLFIVDFTNNSPYVKRHNSKVRGGGALMTAMRLHSFSKCPWLSAEVFFDYSLWNYHPSSNSVASLVFNPDCSFWNIGLGFGGQF